MPLFEPEPTPSPTLTPEEAFVKEHRRRMTAFREKVIQEFNALMSFSWNEPPILGDALTAEQRMAALGADAGPLFQVAGGLKSVVVAAHPDSDVKMLGVPVPFAHEGGIQFNEGGTVTLNRLT